ncbi:MAG: MBL fold metallo-hydrolase [Candidatus Micrarchaeia archaeon]
MASLTFYGGINEIGGNKILVEDKGARVFFDFGQSFSLLDDYFIPESYLFPRERFGLRDYFEFGLIPMLKGLYSQEALAYTELEFSEPEFDGVFISHAHFDHVAHLNYLHPEIPIYLGDATKRILDSTSITTRTSFFPEGADIRTFRSGKEIDVGGVKVTPIHVDHSVPGAYGFLIETSGGVIAYTGDFRKHGPRADMTEEFIEKAKCAEPEALIIEGTRVADVEKRKNHTEEFVRRESRKIVENAKGLVLAMRYPKDLDRMMTFYGLAKESGKTLVISMKTAHLLLSLKDDPHISLPDPFADKNIEVYCRLMLRYNKWEAEMIEKCIGSDYVHENLNNVILELDFYHLTELIDIRPDGGECIHSMSEPIEEDPISVISDDILENWLIHFGMRRHQLHASGHLSRQEVMSAIKEISPKLVFPVHTENPMLFRESGTKVELVEKGNRIEI